MTRMIASKRVKYPHGSAGKEYKPGEKFTALSERDAKALYLAGKANYDSKGKKNIVDLPPKAMEPKAEESKPEIEAPTYHRRDMRPEGE